MDSVVVRNYLYSAVTTQDCSDVGYYRQNASTEQIGVQDSPICGVEVASGELQANFFFLKLHGLPQSQMKITQNPCRGRLPNKCLKIT